MQVNSLNYRTVNMKLTKPDENITDLMNLMAIVCFKANVPRQTIFDNVERVVDEQYVQCFLNAPQTKNDVPSV